MIDKRVTPELKVKQGDKYIDKNGVHRKLPVGKPWSQSNQPTPEAKSAGHKRFSDRRRLANDILAVLVESGTMSKGLDVIREQVDSGDLSNFMKVQPIIVPRNVDITSDGERVMMGAVVVDGLDLDIDIGTVASSDTENE